MIIILYKIGHQFFGLTLIFSSCIACALLMLGAFFALSKRRPVATAIIQKVLTGSGLARKFPWQQCHAYLLNVRRAHMVILYACAHIYGVGGALKPHPSSSAIYGPSLG